MKRQRHINKSNPRSTSHKQSKPTDRSCILTPALLAKAIAALENMALTDKKVLLDEIQKTQPNLLYSTLAPLKSHGESQQTQMLISFLLLARLAMSYSQRNWPLITEQTISDSLRRLTEKIKSTESVSPSRRAQGIRQYTETHAEPYLLALAHEEISKAGWHSTSDGLSKHSQLVLLTLVESIGQASEQLQDSHR